MCKKRSNNMTIQFNDMDFRFQVGKIVTTCEVFRGGQFVNYGMSVRKHGDSFCLRTAYSKSLKSVCYKIVPALSGEQINSLFTHLSAQMRQREEEKKARKLAEIQKRVERKRAKKSLKYKQTSPSHTLA